jgi:RNA polymerase sigma factor (sigma-70 family)
MNLVRRRERQTQMAHGVGEERLTGRERRQGWSSVDPDWTKHVEREELVRDAMAGLNEKWASVLNLHYYAGLSCREIADVLGLAMANVRIRLYRGRRELKRRMTGGVAARGVGRDEVR